MCFFSRLLDCKKIPLSYLYLGVLEQGDVQEGGFQRMCKESLYEMLLVHSVWYDLFRYDAICQFQVP